MALDNFEGDMSGISEEYTLESILAEYKGISYIDGDKKTPKEVLDDKARRIVQEETGVPATPPGGDGFDMSAFNFPAVPDGLQNSNMKAAEAAAAPLPTEQTDLYGYRPDTTRSAAAERRDGYLSADAYAAISWDYPAPLDNAEEPATQIPFDEPAQPLFAEAMDTESEEPPDSEEYTATAPVSEIDSFAAPFTEPDGFKKTDTELNSFGTPEYSSASFEEEVIRSVSEVMERENIGSRFGDDDYEEPPKRRGFRMREDKPFNRVADRRETEKEEPDPDFRERARAYAIRCNALSGRAVLSLILAVLLTAATFIFESGRPLPFGIGQNTAVAGGVLLIIQIFVMMLGLPILMRGIADLFAGEASAETLVVVSNAVSLLAGIYGMRSGAMLLPYSAISSLSLSFALWGERFYMQGIADTLRSAATVENPHSMISEYRQGMDRTVVRKTLGRYKGFYGNLQQSDVTELAYRYATPLLLLFCVLMTVVSAVTHKDFSNVPAMLGATCAAAATFTSTIAFASPFRTISRQERANGSAVAGAGGIDDIFYMDGLCISDEDLYPADTLDVGSVRILDQVTPEKAIRYTASMIVASGSCLARVFTQILVSKGMSLITTQDFTAGEGGVSGVIRREQVHTGNYAYMNLYGVRVPDELKIGNAIYTAVDGRMIAMFSVDYRPSNTIRNAIMAILRHGVKLYLTVRDFNITPMTVEQKFKIPMEDFELLPIGSTYSLSGGEDSGKIGRSVAVCPDGGLVEMSRIISSARRVKLVSLIGTIISVASAIAGVLLMAVLGWSGGAAKPGNLLLFMAAPIVIMLITELVTGRGKRI